MGNLFASSDPKEFFVWIDPTNIIVHNNAEIVGSFSSVPQDEHADNLMFLPNPNYVGMVSPFQANLLRAYMAEYNLEIARRYDGFNKYPSRLNALYLLESEEEAQQYAKAHPDHTSGRILKRGTTNGDYIYSCHDTSWIDFMRLGGYTDDDTLRNVTSSYWSGVKVEAFQLQHFGRPWTQKAVIEILFLGRLDFR